jgi:predicted small lipoprotein YifL
LTRDRHSALTRLGLAAALVAALALAGCGRKGPLDPPPGAAVDSPPPQQTSILSSSLRPQSPNQPPKQAAAPPPESTETAFDAEGNPIAGPGRRQRFFLDFLLD